MSESQNDTKNDMNTSTTSSSESTRARYESDRHAIAERAVNKSNVSLADQRRSGRTLGFLGLSTVGHVAILVALASVPMAIHEIKSGDNKPAGSGEVSMVDTSHDSIATSASAKSSDNSTVDASVMTDDSSDVVISPTKPEVKPAPKVKATVVPIPEKTVISIPENNTVEKLPAKKTAKAVTKPFVKSTSVVEDVVSSNAVTEETQDAPPVLLANPPADDETENVAGKESIQEPKAAPKVEAIAKPREEPTEDVAQTTPAVAPAAPVASKVTSKSAAESEAVKSSEGTATAGSSSAVAQNSTGDDAGQGGEGQGGSEGAVAGPIRDASELKALSGNPNPVYPARDRLARKEGTAVILGRVSADGRVVETTLEKSSGSANMDAASVQAFRGWRFQAGQQGWVRKPFQFRLVGDAKEVPAPLGKGLKR